MKVCNACKTEKSYTEFHKRTAAKDGLQGSCKKCNNSNARKWMKDNPEQYESNWRKNSYGSESLIKRKASRYGLTVEQLKTMIDEADGICRICGRSPGKGLVIDHCHNSNKVRGLICHNCNTSLGLMQDNIDFLQNAIEYLKTHAPIADAGPARYF